MNRQQLADAMLKGLNTEGVVESKGNYISSKPLIKKCFACALGLALIGCFDGDYEEAEKVYDDQYLEGENGEYDIFSTLLDIPASLAIEIEHKHLNGQTIEQIAAWLKGGDHD